MRETGKNRRRTRGVCLLEAMTAIFVLSVVGVALLKTLTASAQCSYTSALSCAALYRCQEKIEEILADTYLQIDDAKYPPEFDLVLDSRGTLTPEDDVRFNRVVTIVDESTDERSMKRVTVHVIYTFTGETAMEQLSTLVVKAGR